KSDPIQDWDIMDGGTLMVRLIFGLTPSIFHLAHVSADFYLAASRWEPFGIMVLEAHSSKLPVIGSKVGGIKETILDIRENPDLGTGLLIPSGEKDTLVETILDMVKMIEIAEVEQFKPGNTKMLIEEIKQPKLREIVRRNPGIYYKIRENALKRIEESFRWKDVARKELNIIKKVLEKQ
ncbi:MAG: glycosyltransferase, partial [Candidatus Hodarchaeota archaeon]